MDPSKPRALLRMKSKGIQKIAFQLHPDRNRRRVLRRNSRSIEAYAVLIRKRRDRNTIHSDAAGIREAIARRISSGSGFVFWLLLMTSSRRFFGGGGFRGSDFSRSGQVQRRNLRRWLKSA
jgi:hypothetical protein